MTRSKYITYLTTAALVLAGFVLTACGSGDDSNAGDSDAPPKNAHRLAATVDVANDNLGKILVNSQGHTLYVFRKDSGTKSTCSGACAAQWPPLRVTGKPTVAGGANASIVATSARSDGQPQVTYHGHPLYLFAGDQGPNDTNGQGVNAFGGLWYAVSASGDEVTTSAGSATSLGY